MQGITITVHYPARVTRNALGEAETEYEDEQVANVLILPPTTTDLANFEHGEGVGLSGIVYFPRTWKYRSLKGATIEHQFGVFSVIGDPVPAQTGLKPTRWLAMPVYVSRQEG